MNIVGVRFPPRHRRRHISLPNARGRGGVFRLAPVPPVIHSRGDKTGRADPDLFLSPVVYDVNNRWAVVPVPPSPRLFVCLPTRVFLVGVTVLGALYNGRFPEGPPAVEARRRRKGGGKGADGAPGEAYMYTRCFASPRVPSQCSAGAATEKYSP